MSNYYAGAPAPDQQGSFYGSTQPHQRQPHGNTGYADVSSWSTNQSQQNSSSQGYAAPAPAQSSFFGGGGGGASVFNPAMAMAVASAGGLNNDALMKAGEKFFQDGTARMIPGLESTMLLLRNYFAVDNRYVIRKMKKVLFPFLDKEWQREVSHTMGALRTR